MSKASIKETERSNEKDSINVYDNQATGRREQSAA